ncbi:Calcineurin-Binding Protein Cabin-1 [Manis pentadactyla]|nr:Calcineurin-Binding Protein Cabin-1 [Manis pentadactyla]
MRTSEPRAWTGQGTECSGNDVSCSSTYDVRAQGRHKGEGRKCTPYTQLPKLSQEHVSVSRTRYTTAPRCKDV